MSTTTGNDVERDGQLLLLVCCLCPLVCGLIGAILAYIVFGIIFLIDDQDVCKPDDSYSQLWIYSLVSLLLTFVSSMLVTELRSCFGKTLKGQLSAHLFLEALGLIYGLIIIYGGYTCENLTQTGLYIWALVTVYFHAFSVVIGLIAYIYFDQILLAVETLSKENVKEERFEDVESGKNDGHVPVETSPLLSSTTNAPDQPSFTSANELD